MRIAVNVALGRLRKRALWKESSLDEPREGEDGDYFPLEIESWSEDPEKSCLNSELQQILADVIQKLDPKSQTIFTLRDVEKFSTYRKDKNPFQNRSQIEGIVVEVRSS